MKSREFHIELFIKQFTDKQVEQSYSCLRNIKL